MLLLYSIESALRAILLIICFLIANESELRNFISARFGSREDLERLDFSILREYLSQLFLVPVDREVLYVYIVEDSSHLSSVLRLILEHLEGRDGSVLTQSEESINCLGTIEAYETIASGCSVRIDRYLSRLDFVISDVLRDSLVKFLG